LRRLIVPLFSLTAIVLVSVLALIALVVSLVFG